MNRRIVGFKIEKLKFVDFSKFTSPFLLFKRNVQNNEWSKGKNHIKSKN